jgi:hypothetical protein
MGIGSTVVYIWVPSTSDVHLILKTGLVMREVEDEGS